MKYIKIKNKGLLDIRLISLMGGTTKTNDQYKIGKFGTGLKYVLAYVLRNNLDIKIFINGLPVIIDTKRENINGTDFEIIYIDDERTSITTNMGLEWKAWMIIRELWCNALDEGEADWQIMDQELIGGVRGETYFYIQLSKELWEVISNWDRYFLHKQTPIFSNDQIAIYPGGQCLEIYKNGVLIHADEKNRSVFRYDIKDAQINELREFKGHITSSFFDCIRQLDKETIALFVENSTDEKYYESDMDYEWYSRMGDGWKEYISGRKFIYPEVIESMKEQGHTPDTTNVTIIPKSLYKKITSQFNGLSASGQLSTGSHYVEATSQVLLDNITRCISVLNEHNYNVPFELKFQPVIFEDQRTIAKLDREKKVVYMSMLLESASEFELTTMIVEETEHYVTNMSDHTREFQQHFINLYVRKLLTK